MILLSTTLKADEIFDGWRKELIQQAIQEGISPIVAEEVLTQAKLLPKVIALDRAQPEFMTSFSDYVGKRVTANQISRGIDMQQRYATMFNDVERRYGIPQAILLAFWGMETNYGANQGHFNTISALLTLAYEGRRAEFFRQQLFDAMRILEARHISMQEMRGSWAGAMGHMQFMPSTFLKYGVDVTSDGKIDVWRTLPDAIVSAANYLASVGWHHREPVAIEVSLPETFPWQEAQLQKRKTIREWDALKVARIDGAVFVDKDTKTAIVLPQGWQGPAFMVFDNFYTLMDWNRSVNYALSVSLLAQRINESNISNIRYEGERVALTLDSMRSLQEALNQLGFEAGQVDGFPGVQTQMAIRAYQQSYGLKADGYPNPFLLKHIEQNKELASKTE